MSGIPGQGAGNYASAIGVPVQYTDVRASLTGPRGRSLGNDDAGTQFADMLVTPIAAGYHFDKVNHIAFSLPIYVPTGAYTEHRLAKPGQNNYTFIATVAFTHQDGKPGEFSLMVSAGALLPRTMPPITARAVCLTLDALWNLGLSNGWSAVLAAGYVQQITEDKGDTADALGGFRGRSVGAGPSSVGVENSLTPTPPSARAGCRNTIPKSGGTR